MSLQNQALQRLADWPDRRADYLKISSSNVMVSNFCRCTFSSFSQMSVKPSPSPSALTLTSAVVSITTSESLLATFDNNNNDVRTLGSNDKEVEKEKKGRESRNRDTEGKTDRDREDDDLNRLGFIFPGQTVTDRSLDNGVENSIEGNWSFDLENENEEPHRHATQQQQNIQTEPPSFGSRNIIPNVGFFSSKR